MRITGGRWRSRTLHAPKGTATRPTSDRVREAIFSMLASDGILAANAPRVLDLYAGSGALAFEALSRGASDAVLVEHAGPALAAIRENAKALSVAIRIVASRVDRGLATLTEKGESFDLVFADPPYADVRELAFAAILEGVARVVAANGAFVLEHAASDSAPVIAGLEHDRSRRQGDTLVSLYRAANRG